jgi:hypothetical protein
MNNEQIQKVINLLSDKNDNKSQVLAYLKKQLKKDNLSDEMSIVHHQLSFAHANIRTLYLASKNGDVPKWAICDSLESIDNVIFEQLETIFNLFSGANDE